MYANKSSCHECIINVNKLFNVRAHLCGTNLKELLLFNFARLSKLPMSLFAFAFFPILLKRLFIGKLIVMHLEIGTPKTINFLIETNVKLMVKMSKYLSTLG